ncbi:MAG: protein TolQ [Rhodospirillaceae bacterium]|nr:protein TolQ [Rhodospirillaceae bacterium]
MEQTVIDAVTLGGSKEAMDLSIMSLFWRAHWVVKAVMVMLLVASVWSWAIILDKVWRLRRLHLSALQFEDAFWSGGSLDDLYERISQQPQDPMTAVFSSAMREWRRASTKGAIEQGLAEVLRDRIDRVMQITLGREMEGLERYMTFLASVGSTAPFVGLFGTVWGIMNSFQAIAVTKQTSLAVVAPGIAEALLATALGLVAAIPAVIGYNKISSELGRYGGRMEAFAGEFSAILSRQMEEGSK